MKKRYSLIAAAMIGVLGLAKVGSAATIAFTTTLLNSPTNNLINLGSGVTVTYTPASLSFDTTLPPADLPPFTVDYGTFAITVPSGSYSDLISATPYTIQLTVTQPGSATGTVVGDISGIFKKVGKTSQDTIQFAFTPEPGAVGPLTFNVDNIHTITWDFDSTNIGSSGPGPAYTGDMLGTVGYTLGAPVPLPASVLSGSALLGGIFLAKARSRKNAV